MDGTIAYDLYHPVSLLKSVSGELIGDHVRQTLGGAANSANTIGAGGDSLSPAHTRHITEDEVAIHNIPDDCYMILHGHIYDLTEYALTHPGGASIVTNLCGRDASAQYDLFHPVGLLVTVESSKIGELATAGRPNNDDSNSSSNKVSNSGDSQPPETPIGITYDEVRKHNTPDDCWQIIAGKVYDLTEYAKQHPGGSRIITNYAGEDATAAYR